MKMFKTLVVIGFIFVGVWAFTAPAETFGKNGSASSDTKNQKTSARDLYNRNCARCHGTDGKSETSKGIELAATDLTGSKVQKMNRRKISAVISNGDGDMPAFNKKLSKAEIDSLANYVLAF